MTGYPAEPARRFGGRSRSKRPLLVLIACLALAAVALSACRQTPADDETGTPPQSAGMGGETLDVQVTQEALGSEPAPPDLSNPEGAVRSYLAWTSYAYRIGQSAVALSTMTPYQEVRVDSYLQYNLQQNRLLDQTLVSITFGAPIADGERTLLPAVETWQYRYVSATEAGKVLGGPYEASYDATYTVVPNGQGGWAVDSVEATSRGPVE